MASDVLTLEEAKAAILNNAGTTNDDLLAAYVTAVSQYLDKVCGPIVQRPITGEVLDGGPGVDRVIFLKSRPILSVTTVTEYVGTASTVLTEETPGTVPAEGFLLDPDAGILHRRRGGNDSHWGRGRRNVVIDYTAGRFTETATVDERFKRAAGIVLGNIWRREHGLGSMPVELLGVTYALPNAAKAILAFDLQMAS